MSGSIDSLVVGQKPMKVVIIGGSSAGLMHGIMLKRLGHNVHILEQHPTSVRQGQAAGISTGTITKEFLNKHDRCTEPHYVMSDSFIVRDQAFKQKDQRHMPLPMTNWETLYYRLRANFDGLHSAHVSKPPAADLGDGRTFYDVGKRVVDLVHREEEKTVEVKYESMTDARGGSLLADLVIGADGASSHTRKLLVPGVQRNYAGFVTWRGTVPEQVLSPDTVKQFEGVSTLYYFGNSYMIIYIIPGEGGNVTPGSRMLNVAWYENQPSSSESFAKVMNDIDGVRHYYTLPAGKMRPDVWEQQRQIAKAQMAAPIKEIILNISTPFITAISDYESPQAAFCGGRVLLVGDALTLFRTHIAQSTSQAAKHCLLLEKVLKGEMNINQWEKEVLMFGHLTRLRSPTIGSYYMSSYLALAYWLLRLVLAQFAARLGYIL